jgi:hypothetical protein
MINRILSQPEVQQSRIRQYLEEGIRTEDNLRVLLGLLKEPKIGTKVICGKSDHSSIFQFLYEVISCAVLDYIVWGNRSGSKSYLAGLITWFLSGRFPLLETSILGGSEAQSEKSYKAMESFWCISNLYDILKKEPLITKTEWLNGSVANILTASQRSVRGPHPQRLILDEVDEMDFEIFQASLSQPLSKHNIPSSTGIYSTNHNIGGTMDKALAIAEEKGGYKVYKHCVWECIESCRDYNCSTCPLSSICPGPQVKEADGYYKITDLIKILHTTSWETFQREWLCEKVGRGDLVYQHEFDEEIHCPLSLPGFDPKQYVYISIDWGGVNPFSVGAWQYFETLQAWIRIDEVYMGNTKNPDVIKKCSEKIWWNNIVGGIADPSRADLIAEWNSALPKGIGIQQANNEVDAGVEAVKNALRPVLGNPKIYFNRICVNTRRELLTYKIKNNKIVKENDHAPDEIRYFVMWKINKTNQAFMATPDWNVMPDRS